MSLAGKHVIVTAGPTHEPIDPVRYIANRSSGRQGFAIAAAAAEAGARVTLIAGPVALATPDKVTRIDGDKVYYNPSRSESTSGNDTRLKDYDTSRELSMSKADLLKFETEQGEERKVVIWIN